MQGSQQFPYSTEANSLILCPSRARCSFVGFVALATMCNALEELGASKFKDCLSHCNCQGAFLGFYLYNGSVSAPTKTGCPIAKPCTI